MSDNQTTRHNPMTKPQCSDTNEHYWFQNEPVRSIQTPTRSPLGMTDDEFRRVFKRLCKEQVP